MMHRITLIISIIISSIAMSSATDLDWASTVYVKPDAVAGVKLPAVNLNDKWQFRLNSSSKWTSIEVPGEAVMQGFGIKHDVPFFYQRRFNVPADYAGKTILLRFDGVYGHAILYVNGKKVREHHGGFTRWEADVTKFVKTGKSNSVMLEVEDRVDDISYASGYAHHPIGGILRDVTLFALPQAYVHDVKIDALLDSLYRNGTVQLQAAYAGNEEEAKQWAEELKEAFPGYDFHMDPLSLSVACHIGAGALAVACTKKIEIK